MSAHNSQSDGHASAVPAPAPLPGRHVRLGTETPLRLDCGAELADFPVALLAAEEASL